MRGEKPCGEIEAAPHRTSAAGASDGGFSFADADERSHYNGSLPCDEFRCSSAFSHEIEESCRDSCISDCSSHEVDLECGDAEIVKTRDEKVCRICHLSLESRESGVPIELGCSCKDDLGAAHKQCAETWFKIKGNKTCEICGSMAKNVATAGEAELIEQPSEVNSITIAHTSSSETRRFWQGHRFLNFLLACMIFAFVLSWLFHFNVPN